MHHLLVSLEYPASGKTKDRPRSVLVQKSGHVDDDGINFCVGCVLRDGWTKESLHRRSVGLVSNLKRCELNELVENLTCLNALEGKFWKSDQKIVTDEKINPKIVTDRRSR